MSKNESTIQGIVYTLYVAISIALLFVTAWIGENIPIWLDKTGLDSLDQYNLKHTAYFLLYGAYSILWLLEELPARKACQRLVLAVRIFSTVLIPCLTVLPLLLFGKPTPVFFGGLTPPLSVIFVLLLYRIFTTIPKKAE